MGGAAEKVAMSAFENRCLAACAAQTCQVQSLAVENASSTTTDFYNNKKKGNNIFYFFLILLFVVVINCSTPTPPVYK